MKTHISEIGRPSRLGESLTSMETATVSLDRSGGRDYCYEDVEWKVGVLSYEREESATVLQGVLRGDATRKHTLGELSRQEENAALMIQATIEGEMTRREDRTRAKK